MEMHSEDNSAVQRMEGHQSNMSEESRIPPARPISPCDSEISVGCEDEQKESAGSPMDMSAEVNFTTEDDDDGDDTEVEPHSPSTSRGGVSPALSSVSVHTESFTYLSDDDYFRPLKRLAMSSSSPTPSEQRALSESPHASPRVDTPQTFSPDSRPQNILSPPLIKKSDEEEEEEERQQRIERSIEEEKNNRLRSFSILDILSYKPSRRKSSVPVKIVRPWDNREEKLREEKSSNRSNDNKTETGKNGKQDKGGALDALFKMTNKTLDNLNKEEKTGMFRNQSLYWYIIKVKQCMLNILKFI